jgi:hypothetical protein
MRTVQVDYNNTIDEHRLVASRRRMPNLSVSEIVNIADDADDATYLAQVESISPTSVTFLVSWVEQPAKLPVVPVAVTKAVGSFYGRLRTGVIEQKIPQQA